MGIMINFDKIKMVVSTIFTCTWPFLKGGYNYFSQHNYLRPCKSICFLGVFYAVELMNYQLPNIILNGGSTFSLNDQHKDWQSLSLHVGMFFGGLCFALRIRKKPKSVHQLLNLSIFIHAIGATLTALTIWATYIAKITLPINSFCLLAVSRFIFGIGFSAGLGLAMTLIVENLPRSVRTWAATMVGMMGFSGPVIANLLNVYIPNKGALLLIGCALSWVVLKFPFPKDSEFRKTESLPKHNILKGEVLKLFGICSLMGISVQFFSDTLSWLPRIDPIWNNPYAHAYRYGGMILGTLIAGVLSKFLGHRRKVIWGFVLTQGFAVAVAAYIHAWYRYSPPTDMDGHTLIISGVYVMFGVVCGHWIITILQIAEQFSIQERAFMIVFIPNIYRVATIFIIALNLFYYNHKPRFIDAEVEKKFQEFLGNLSEPIYFQWLSEYPLVLFGFWLVFVVGSFSAVILSKDNFEGDAYEAEYTKQDLPKIMSSDIRAKLSDDIKENVWAAREDTPFLAKAGAILAEHLEACLKGHYVLSTFFYAEDGSRRLQYAGFGGAFDRFDQDICRRYEIGKNVPSYRPTVHHAEVHTLVRAGAAASYALWMSDQKNVSGLLFYYAGWNEDVAKTDLENYRAFDLSKIELDEHAIKKYMPLIRTTLSIESKKVLLEEYYKSHGSHFDEWFLPFFYGENWEGAGRDETVETGFKKTLMLHRLDAVDYGPSNYYNYYISPYYGNSEQFKTILVLKTVIQLQKKSLDQIRALLSWIILYRSTKIYQYSSLQFFRDEDHATREHLRGIIQDLKQFEVWYNRSRFMEEIYPKFDWERLDKISGAVGDAALMANRIYAIRSLNALLVRYRGGAKRSELELKGLPSPELVPLKQEINKVWEQQLKITKEVDHAYHQKLRGLKNDVPADIKVNVIEIALHVILDELIRNAVLNTPNDGNAYIYVGWLNNPNNRNCKELCIKNNVKENFGKEKETELTKMVNDKIDHTNGRMGLANIHRILRFPLMSAHEQNWNIKCQVNERIVTMSLIIPKQDITEA